MLQRAAAVILLIFLTILVIQTRPLKKVVEPVSHKTSGNDVLSPTLTPTITEIPHQKLLHNDYQVFQTFNNCGPASLSMALSYFNINQSQEVLGQSLRPYQNPQGDNDDKSVTLAELGHKAEEYGFTVYHRPNGSIKILELFIANDIPVITRTLLHTDDDIGHYRVVKGYDKKLKQIVQDDSMQGHNVIFSYEEFSRMWKQFNYEYVVIIPSGKEGLAKDILAEDIDEKKSWEKAISNSKQDLLSNPNDINARFNLSVALYHVGSFSEAVQEYEKIEAQLSSRTLWYKIEPIQAYYELGNDEKVFSITELILNNQNRAFSELYMLRGKIYQRQGNAELARQEFEKAVFYNTNLQAAQSALSSVQ